MKINKTYPFLFPFFALFTFLVWVACSNNSGNSVTLSTEKFSLRAFNPIANFQSDSIAGKSILLDYNNAMEGFVIPSVSQTEDGQFTFEFELKNTDASPQKFYYKIFYQNERYKFPEIGSFSNKENALAEENFYGSWEAIGTTFKESEAIPNDDNYHTVSDKFRIVGNPRNEQRYFSNGKNDRWKRNPRVGAYKFMLVVCTSDDLKNIPNEVKDIGLKLNEHFVNPFYYFDFGSGKSLKNTIVYKSETVLNVKAKPNLGAGVYINNMSFTNPDFDKSYFCNTCGQDSNLYKNAPIQQFINYVDASTKMENIPVIADILKDNYSVMDYNWNKSFYKKEELIPTLIQTAKHPCQTVFSVGNRGSCILFA